MLVYLLMGNAIKSALPCYNTTASVKMNESRDQSLSPPLEGDREGEGGMTTPYANVTDNVEMVSILCPIDV